MTQANRGRPNRWVRPAKPYLSIRNAMPSEQDPARCPVGQDCVSESACRQTPHGGPVQRARMHPSTHRRGALLPKTTIRLTEEA
jgi:hypothetical protein